MRRLRRHLGSRLLRIQYPTESGRCPAAQLGLFWMTQDRIRGASESLALGSRSRRVFDAARSDLATLQGFRSQATLMHAANHPVSCERLASLPDLWPPDGSGAQEWSSLAWGGLRRDPVALRRVRW